MSVQALSTGFSGTLSWRSAAVVFLVLLGYGMKATVVDTAAVMNDQQLAAANEVQLAIWDTTPPTAVDVKIPNGTGVNNEPDVADKINMFFSEPIDPASIKAGWDGSWTPMTVTIDNNNGSYGGNDIVTFDENIGVIDLGGAKYTKAQESVFSARMKWNVNTLKLIVELQTLVVDKTRTTDAKTVATYYPYSGIEDTGRNAIDDTVHPTRNAKHF